MLGKKEQEFIDQMKASGHPINAEKMNAKFKLIIRPFTTIGVASLEIMSWLEDEVFPAASEMTFDSGITAIVITPVIFDRKIAEPPKDSVKFNRLERSIFVGNNIALADWNSATGSERLKILLGNVKNSLGSVSQKYLSPNERQELEALFDNAYPKILHRFVS